MYLLSFFAFLFTNQVVSYQSTKYIDHRKIKQLLRFNPFFIQWFFDLKILNFLFTLLASLLLHAQTYNPNRYSSRIFSSVNVVQNVQYGSAPQWVWPYWNENLFLDVYSPIGDPVQNRPLVILAHSGGFASGSKNTENIVALCDSLARLGYVTASIDYRKGLNPLDSVSAERAVYRGVQDAKAAIRFFKQNHELFGIDTNYIYFGGMSAGGMMSLYVGYMDLESERPLSTFGGLTVNDLGCLDCTGNNWSNSSKVRAIMDYWGGMNDTTMIQFQDTPILIMHGYNDEVVSYYYDHPFGLATLPLNFGASPIFTRATNMEMDVELITSYSNLHMLDGSNNGYFSLGTSPNTFWYDTLLPRTRSFLFRQTRSLIENYNFDTVYICPNDTFSLSVSPANFEYFEWLFDSNSFQIIGDHHLSNVSFISTATVSDSIGVIGFNSVYCVSDTVWFDIVRYPELSDVIIIEQFAPLSFHFSVESFNVDSVNWTFGDGFNSFGIDISHTYNTEGIYPIEAQIITNNGCSFTLYDTLVTSEFTQLTENETLSNKMIVAPNPLIIESSRSLLIRFPDQEFLLGELRIFSPTGSPIFVESLNELNNTISLEKTTLESGIYYIEFTSPSLYSVQKLVVN